MIGIDPASDGLARARAAGLETSVQGIDWIVANRDHLEVVFDATSAGAHVLHAPRLAEAGLQSIDLTPAKLGPGVVPVVNLDQHEAAPDINLITCGGQATIPMVAAVSAVTPVAYAEIVATIASKSAGPGTRQSIDQFTRTTAGGVQAIGGADRGKADHHPRTRPSRRCSCATRWYCAIGADADRDAIAASVAAMAQRVCAYVPGYRLRTDPLSSTTAA